MHKWALFLFLIFSSFTPSFTSIHAQEGKFLFECGDEVIEFPANLYSISPFIQDAMSGPLQPYQSASFRYSADVGYMRILSGLVARLHLAARDLNGNPVESTKLNKNTIFVSQLVRKKLLWQLMSQTIALYHERREGIVSSVISKSRTGSSLPPRREFVQPAYSSSSGSSSSRSKDPHKKSLSVTHSFRLPLSKLHNAPVSPRGGTTTPRSSRPISPRGDNTPKSPRNLNQGINQILGGLYTLSLELDMMPLTNLIADAMITRLKREETGNRECLQGTLRMLGFGSFLEKELPYLKKHLALKELNKEEFSIADYIGLYGQPSRSASREMNLSKRGLTSLYGIHLIHRPMEIECILLHNNFILGSDLDPNFPTQPFMYFERLRYLFLYQNHLTNVPVTIFDGVSLDIVEIQNNHLISEWVPHVQGWLSKGIESLQFAPQSPQTFGYR